MSTKQKKQKRLYAALLLSSLAVFVTSAFFASHKVILPWEKHLLLDIYNLPTSWRGLALIITQFGSAWILVFVAVALLVGRKRAQHWGRMVVINGAITYVLVEVTKYWVHRPRPAELVSGLAQRDVFVRGLGFPSGHTAMATVISLTLVRYLPKRWRWLPVPWIGLVALSRIYLGVHAPLDVVGGFALGMIVISSEPLLRVE